jgi:molybdenum cofactor synthesis domain-containing protein
MDGYAVASYLTTDASVQQPIYMIVEATVAAGSQLPKPTRANNRWDNLVAASLAEEMLSVDDLPPCMEIMTGARFPPPMVKGGRSWHLDACVKVEDVTVLAVGSDQKRLIRVTKPVPHFINRRCAGEDFSQKDLLARSGQILRQQHVMALASVGLAQVMVHRRLRVSIITTGDEVVSHDADTQEHYIHDANAPLLITTLQRLGVEVVYLGIAKDNIGDLVRIIRPVLQECETDIIISTGAVSCGKYDFVEDALKRLNGEIKFHHVAVRPGHPVLFGAIRSATCEWSAAVSDRSVAYFGLPGNPIAAAACLRFFVIPFLQMWHGISLEQGNLSKTRLKSPLGNSHRSGNGLLALLSEPSKHDSFRLGLRSADGLVEIVDGQASHKIQPLLRANCWIVLSAAQAVGLGQFVKTLQLFPEYIDGV